MKQNLGFISALISAAMFSAMAILIKTFSGIIPSSEVLFIRSIIISIFTCYFLFKDKESFKNGSIKYLYYRSFFGAFALLIFFYLVQEIAVANVILIGFLTPVLILLYNVIIYKNFLPKQKLIGLVLIIFSLILVKIDSAVYFPMTLFVLGIIGACFQSAAFLNLKKASQEIPIFFILCIFSVTTSLVSLLFFNENWFIPTLNQTLTLLVISLLSFFGHFLMTFSYKTQNTSIVNVLSKTNILWAALFEYLILAKASSNVEMLCYSAVLVGIMLLTGVKLSKFKKSSESTLN